MMTSASCWSSVVVSDASGNVTFIAECWTNVVVMTKNISRVSITSISEMTLISKSSCRVEPSRISSTFPYDRNGRRRRRASRTRGRHGLGVGREFVHQHDDVLFHVDDEVGDASAEIAVKEIRRNRHAQARRRADQSLADAAGHLERVADAGNHDREEHLYQAEHGAEHTYQRRDEGYRAECVEEAFEPMHDVTAGVFDALLHDLARTHAHAQRGG